MRILIIGGAGAFGSFYANLFAKHGFEIGINDLAEESAQKLCQENGFEYIGNTKEVKNFDVVIISVPNKDAPEIIKKVSKEMKKDSLLIDFCSVKTHIEKELTNVAKLGLQVASLHPMHGPRVNGIAGQSIAVIEITKSDKLKQILFVFEKENASLVKTTIKEHDELLSIVQGLTHYSQFVSAATIKDLEVDLKKTSALTSPNYSLFLSLIARVVLQNPQIYSEIQLGNPLNEKVRRAFTKNAEELENICLKNDSKALAKKIIHSAQEFKEGELFLIESDRIVAAQKYLLDTLKRNVGKKFLVENLLTKSMHYGKIKSIEHGELTLAENQHETKISLHKLRATTKEEMNAWKQKNLSTNTLDFSFIVPKNANKETIAHLLTKSLKHQFIAIDEYSGPKFPADKKSITIRLTFFEDEEKENVNSQTTKLIKEMGFELR
ncbi:MAG: prephenate dehydrogenase/arogenate dehydrogenase family protein [archaeon]|jgi:prephenate dehydrogenase